MSLEEIVKEKQTGTEKVEEIPQDFTEKRVRSHEELRKMAQESEMFDSFFLKVKDYIWNFFSFDERMSDLRRELKLIKKINSDMKGELTNYEYAKRLIEINKIKMDIRELLTVFLKECDDWKNKALKEGYEKFPRRCDAQAKIMEEDVGKLFVEDTEEDTATE